ALVRMTERGEVLGWRFAKRLDLETRNWLRNLMDATRVGLAGTDAVGWTVAEYDAIGKAEVAVAWDGPERDGTRAFTKKKLRYLDGKKGELRPELDAGASGRFDPRLGWLTSIESHELARLEVKEVGTTVLSHATFRMDLEGSGPATPSSEEFLE